MIVFTAFLRAQSNLIGIGNLELTLILPISFPIANSFHFKKLITILDALFLCGTSNFELINQAGEKNINSTYLNICRIGKRIGLKYLTQNLLQGDPKVLERWV